jgi:solute:Na+ symporter, SSS family
MNDISRFELHWLDYLSFSLYLTIICAIGYFMGKRQKESSEGYFLSGRTLPWYVVGASFIASNISTEHFIGMIGASFIFGISIAMYEWGNINSFTVLIWLFIPFLMATRVFTIPEFLERRFNNTLRQIFAFLTVTCNITAFLAAVLYGGGVALSVLFGLPLWVAIPVLGIVSGTWAIYGGLRSVAWTELFTVIIMIIGGGMVTILGLYTLSGNEHSIIEGWRIMIERNKAQTGIWAQAVAHNAQQMVAMDTYNRLSIIQPASHKIVPWPSLIFGFIATGIWYSALNQFMIQRVLAAKNSYHARMGIVFAGYMKILMPVLFVIPGLILFAMRPEVMLGSWDQITSEADRGYVNIIRLVVPIGLRGLFLAALFGAIQSSVSSVLNSTATVVTLDIYKRMFNRDAKERTLVRVGVWTSITTLALSIVIAFFIAKLGKGLFVYIQTLYAFFAPPFSAVFILGILFRRINAKGATVAVISGLGFGLLMKAYVAFWPGLFGDKVLHLVEPFSNQSLIHWVFCAIVCTVVSLLTERPSAEQTSDILTLNWRRLNIFEDLGDRWYKSVILWWGLFAACIVTLVIIFSGHIL